MCCRMKTVRKRRHSPLRAWPANSWRSSTFALALLFACGGTTAEPVVDFSCTFNQPIECGFYEQAAKLPRATLVDTARDGATAVRLYTLAGENRNDLVLSQANTGCDEQREQWWAHSVLLPGDYVAPSRPGEWGMVFDFHNASDTLGYANFQVLIEPGGMKMAGFGGTPSTRSQYSADLGPVQIDRWYDFVYHVKWSSGPDGFFHAWVNGKKKLAYFGPTLYVGQTCYLKLANYHSPISQTVAVIHDRVVRGSSAADVSLTPLD